MTFVTSEQVSSVAVELLARSLVLPMTALRVPATDFRGPAGGTAILRVPNPRTARVQATPGATITYDDIDETEVPVTMAHLYDATKVTDEDMTLAITDFATQVTAPQVSSVARAAEARLAAVMNALPIEINTAGASDVDDDILAARATLGEAEVPLENRWLAVSPDYATYLLSQDNLSPFDAPLDSDAVARAIIGNYRGFRVVETPALTGIRAVAYHQSAFAFGTTAPAAPRGASDSSVATVGDIAMRHLFLFDPDTLSDRSVVSVFAGASLVDADRVVVLGSPGGS